MSVVDELRMLWLPGIHKVIGRPQKSMIGLLASMQYQIYVPTTPTKAELHFDDWDLVLQAYAGDCARMSMAAIETIEGVQPSTALPKSAGWLLVRGYYAGFFAAHAIERMLGISISRLDAAAVNAVDTISALFGAQTTGNLQRGLYRCTADAIQKTVCLEKISIDNTHEALWIDFAALLRSAADQVLLGSKSKSGMETAAKLVELESVLRDGGQAPKGNWLSVVRNRINYQHSHGTWFPYSGRLTYYDSLFTRLGVWRSDPDTISIWPQRGRELQRFIEACAFLVSLCRVMCADMASRCPAGKSFHRYACLNLIDRLSA